MQYAQNRNHDANMTPQEWRERVGRHVEERRKQLRIPSIRAAARSANVSDALWRQVESGERTVAKGVVVVANPRLDTSTKIARALSWPDDALDRLAAGEDPATMPQLLHIEPADANAQPGSVAIERDPEPVVSSADDVDLKSLRERDPEGWEAIMAQARLLLDRARERDR